MSIPIANGWQFDVDEGPDWLFLTLHQTAGDGIPEPPVAARGWALAEERGKTRIVFELGGQTRLNSFLAGQLILFHKRAELADGRFRICGFSENNFSTLKMLRLTDRFPNYPDRGAAVQGHLPTTT